MSQCIFDHSHTTLLLFMGFVYFGIHNIFSMFSLFSVVGIIQSVLVLCFCGSESNGGHAWSLLFLCRPKPFIYMYGGR